METQTQTYRGYGIWLGQNVRGVWYATIRPIAGDPLFDSEPDTLAVGPFLTAEAACREAEWQIDLRSA